MCASLTGEKPIRVAAADQSGTEVVDIFIDDLRDRVIEGKLKRHRVLDLVLGKGQPIVRLRSARLGQVLTNADTGEIAEPDRRNGQDRHRHCDLG